MLFVAMANMVRPRPLSDFQISKNETDMLWSFEPGLANGTKSVAQRKGKSSTTSQEPVLSSESVRTVGPGENATGGDADALALNEGS